MHVHTNDSVSFAKLIGIEKLSKWSRVGWENELLLWFMVIYYYYIKSSFLYID